MTGGILRALDVYTTELGGINLIEASAGTGKTWTITSLYVRLVLELGLNVEQILVVTYTKAATAELHDRIRRRLVEVKSALETGTSEDGFCQKMIETHAGKNDFVTRRLVNAIRSFDEAAVYTIHSFCQRTLSDSAFESGMDFDTELIPNEHDILQQVVDDFWRREIYRAPQSFVEYLLEKRWNPNTLMQEISNHVGKSYLHMESVETDLDFPALEREFADTYRLARTTWRREYETVAALLLNSGLNGNSYRKDSVPKWCDLMSAYFQQDTHHFKIFDKMEKFSTASVAAAVKAGTPPQHEFFEQCEKLLGLHRMLFEVRAIKLKADLLRYCNDELPLRKRSQQVQSYDDLLNNLGAALDGPHGTRLAEAIRQHYPAALIDEFQDTDPVQFRIFDRIYRQGTQPVFLVGDPKQAIYSFRGADIFAYLGARDATTEQYTIGVNQRSDPALIDAVNALFEHNPNPFLFSEISYPHVSPAGKERDALSVEGDKGGALRFWLTREKEHGKPLDKGSANQKAAKATAAEIARLLNLGIGGRAMVGAQPLLGSDIAILVPTHRQGRLVREELLRFGVPSVQYGQDNVFESREALQLERILFALAEPGREALVKASLATELMGMSGEAVCQLGLDEAAWERRLGAFQNYHLMWREHGFARMFRAWFEQEGIAGRLLAFSDGERRLTNLLHLAELLQTAASSERKSIESLLGWFSRRCHQPNSSDEEAQLRLESDAKLVKIVTVHTSKGLEYPVVFCPFLWDGQLWRKNERGVIPFHDPEQDNQLVLDIGSPAMDTHWRLASAERLAEKLRLLYVALTRAKHRCYVVWGLIKDMETSALAWVLHGSPVAADERESVIERLKKHLKDLSTAQIEDELTKVAEKSDGAISIEPIPEGSGIELAPDSTGFYQTRAEGRPIFAARRFGRGLQPTWQMTSFSALVSGRSADSPDYDAEPEVQLDFPTSHTIFRFPSGARAGTCLHAIFETWNFQCKDRVVLEAHVGRKLQAHGFKAEWIAVVADMVENVLAAPLDHSGLRLADLSSGQRLCEMEFTYRLGGLDPAGLKRLLSGPDNGLSPLFRQAAGELDLERISGYMKGFIDLIVEANGRFYLLDYKSNRLGGRREDYGQDAMTRAIARDHYYLQYLIYCVALHRYLGLRLPDYEYARHFGGVFYLFLRGIDSGKGGDFGIYRDCPSESLIEMLDRLLDQREAA